MNVDILAILNQYHVDFDPSRRGWLNVRCPMPGCSDTGKHGGFNIGGSYYTCWKCGAHSLQSVLRRLLRLPGDTIDELLAQNEGRLSVVSALNKKTPGAKKVKWPGQELNSAERRYLKGRGFDPDYLIAHYGIAGGGISGTWKYRVLIPFFQDGVLVSFLGRDITGKSKMRYLNLELEKSVRDPKACLYNLDNCKSDQVFVLEGTTDVWRMGDGFVATLGTAVTPAQVRLLGQRFKKVTFLFDPEPEAQGKARKVGAQLAAMGTEVELIDLELPRDPGDLSPRKAAYLRQELGL